MRRDVDAAIAALAATRAGAFCFDDVAVVGGDRWLAKRRVDAGRWLARPGGTFVLAGCPSSLDQRRHLALLAVGPHAVLSHEAAAELYRFDGIRRGLVVLTTPHDRSYKVLPDVVMHRLDDLRPDDINEVNGFPTTTAARTIIDLAAVVSDLRLQRAIESAITERLASFTALTSVLRRVRRQGKTGISRLVRVLDCLDGRPPPASALERHLAVVAELAGVRAVRQHPLPWDREPVEGCVDAAVVDSRLLLEADGRRWHARLDAMAKDRRRDRQALRAGWGTLRFVFRDLVDDPAGSAEDILATHQQRLAT